MIFRALHKDHTICWLCAFCGGTHCGCALVHTLREVICQEPEKFASRPCSVRTIFIHVVYPFVATYVTHDA
jgi:hypothetical protein